MRGEQSSAYVRDYVLGMNSVIFTQVQVDDDVTRKDEYEQSDTKQLLDDCC